MAGFLPGGGIPNFAIDQPGPITPYNATSVLNSYRQGQSDAKAQQQTNLLKQVGGIAATGGLGAASQAALAGGDVDMGTRLSALDTARKAKVLDIVGQAAEQADTPEKWNSLNTVMTNVFGPGSMNNFEDFKSRDAALMLVQHAKMQLIQTGVPGQPGAVQNAAADLQHPERQPIPIGEPKLPVTKVAPAQSPEGKIQADVGAGVLTGPQAETAMAKATGQLTRGAAESQKGMLDAGFDNLKTVATQIRDHPYLDSVLGAKGMIPNVPGSPAADVQAAIDNLKTQSGIALVNELKATGGKAGTTGFGRITQYEFQQLQNVLASMNEKQSPAQFKTNLQKIIDFADESKKRNADAFAKDYGGASGASATPVGTDLNAPAIPGATKMNVGVNARWQTTQNPTGTPPNAGNIASLKSMANDPKARQVFDEHFGAGSSEFILRGGSL